MPEDIVQKVGIDSTAYVSGVSKMSDAHSKVNSEMGKQVELGRAVTHGMERALFHSLSLIHVMREITAEFQKQRQYQMDLTKETNTSRMASSSALVSLVGPQAAGAYESSIEGSLGIASEDQRREFVKGLEKTGKKRHLSQRMIATAFNAYVRGGETMLPQEELLKIVERSGDDNLQSNIDAYLTKRFNVTPEVHARNRGTIMEDAYSTLPESIKSIVRQNNRATSARYADIMKIVDSGQGARLIDVEEEYERDSREHLAVGLFRGMTQNLIPGVKEMGLKATEERMARDEAMEAVKTIKEQTQRKIIRHDSHGETSR